MKKLLAFALSLLLLATLPLSALAAESPEGGETVSALAAGESSAPPAEEQGKQLEDAPSSTAGAPGDSLEEDPSSGTTATPYEEEAGEPTEEDPEEGSEEPSDEKGPEGEDPKEEDPEEESPGEEPAGDAPAYPLITDEHVTYIEGNNDYVNPQDNLTRAQAAKIIYSLLESPLAGAGNTFTDVPAGQWYKPYVDSMSQMELIEGYGDGTFLPGKNITRVEFVTILSRLYLPQEDQPDLDFADVTTHHWGYAALKNAVARGWLKGYGDGTLNPDGSITRAEAVAIVNRMMGRVPDEAAIDNAGKIFQYLDLDFDFWAYYDIMEASVPHEFVMDETGTVETWNTFSPLPAERAPGYYLEDGQLYLVKEDGYFARNEAVGVLGFDNYGRYTSGIAELDQRLTAIVLAHTDPGASRLANLRSLYDYVVGTSEYLPADWIDEGSSGWEERVALKAFQMGNRGNCYSYAAMFAMLARKLGYQATGVSGWVTTPDWGWEYDTHGWVEISEGGRVYLCDPEETWAYGWDLFYKSYGTTYTHYMVNGVSLG